MYLDVRKIIETGKYEVQRGDTLWEIAEGFQKEFPSLSRLDRFAVEDLVFEENVGAFVGKDKNKLRAGALLSLKFLLEVRKREFRCAGSIREYTFTNEDKLAFNMDPMSFWDGN